MPVPRQLFIIASGCFLLAAPVLARAGADANGIIVYTQRFDGTDTIVNEVEWSYVRATPSLTFSNYRVIWTGAGALNCGARTAGSDGLFYTPGGDLVVGNWQASACNGQGLFWKFDPELTDDVVEGPSMGPFAFHLLLHPNESDFLAAPALATGPACNDGTAGCFGVYSATPLVTTHLCLAPLESASSDVLQPVTFIADGENNMFALYTTMQSVQFGGAGFASFDLDTTTSAGCSGSMSMTSLIPPEIEEAHSISWDPFLSDTDGPDPYSGFIVFANSKLAHIRVDDPGTPGATASVVSSIDMLTEAVCDSNLPPVGEPLHNEFDQGAVTGEGIAIVGDEATGWAALVDYSQNTNGTILDGANTVCLVEFLHDGIDDIAPLTGLGARPGPPRIIHASSFEDGEGAP